MDTDLFGQHDETDNTDFASRSALNNPVVELRLRPDENTRQSRHTRVYDAWICEISLNSVDKKKRNPRRTKNLWLSVPIRGRETPNS